MNEVAVLYDRLGLDDSRDLMNVGYGTLRKWLTEDRTPSSATRRLAVVLMMLIDLGWSVEQLHDYIEKAEDVLASD